jgi:hypothetical protein
MTLGFEALAPLLSHFLSSASQGELGLLDSHKVLMVGHLRCQSLDLGPSLCLPVDQLLPQLLGGPQLLMQALHLDLHHSQMAMVGSTSHLHLIG